MKLFVIISSFTLGIIIGLIGGVKRPKALWWKIMVCFILVAGAWLSIYPRVAASVQEIDMISKYIGNTPIPTMIYINDKQLHQDETTGKTYMYINGKSDFSDNKHKFFVDKENFEILSGHSKWIVRATINSETKDMTIVEIVQSNPWISYPYILSLEDRVKILNFHVPMAWIAVLSYFISMFFSIRFLKTSDYKFDVMASSAASLGTMFAILATVSGMIWAKFNWGSFWNWDPRETSIFILLLIYFAYFALRAGIEREDIRAKSSGVYSIIAFVTVPFLVFVLPRITTGLHPGSQGGDMGGPILSTSKGMLDSQLMFAFGLSVVGFTLLYFWLLNLSIRINLIKKKIGE